MNDLNYGPRERLAAELAFNAGRADHEPVTDSSLTYGDLRAFGAMFSVSGHKLADMLRDSEPHHQPDDCSTEMEITIEDARRIAWALIGYAPDRDDILLRLRRSLPDAALGRAIGSMVRETDAVYAILRDGTPEIAP